MAPTTLITTPIFYVNARPHLGHAYTMVLADAYARFRKLNSPGNRVLLSTGTDEHGVKVRNAALRAGQTEDQFCANVSALFRQLANTLGIAYDKFTRTSLPEHHALVQSAWQAMQEHIYRGDYEGWYSVSDECFYAPAQVYPVGNEMRARETNAVVQWHRESCYMLRVAPFKAAIVDWLQHRASVSPSSRKHDILALVDDFGDVCVSRPRDKCPWGVPVPGDPDHVIYVWFDALLGYLQPASDTMVHVVGKDILKFHTLIWPAMLSALKRPLPTRILCHGHWQVGQQKMSKSVGNVVTPDTLLGLVGPDAFRYCLLAGSKLSADCEYDEHAMLAVYNNDLANQLGNLLARCTSPALLPAWQAAELPHPDDTLTSAIMSAYEEGNFHVAIEGSMRLARECNRLLEERKPWTMDAPTAALLFSHIKRLLQAFCVGIEPVMPSTVAAIKQVLTPCTDGRIFPRILFPRLASLTASESDYCLLSGRCHDTTATTVTSS